MPPNAPPAANRIASVDGAPALIVAIVAVLVAAMALAECDVEEVDEHAAPAFIGWLAKDPATYPMIAAQDRCAMGWAPKVDVALPPMEPNS